MIRLVTPFPRHFGLGGAGPSLRFTGSRLVSTSPTVDTTLTKPDNVNTNDSLTAITRPDNENTDSSSAELDLDEYMKRAKRAFQGISHNPKLLFDELSARPSTCLSEALRDHLPQIFRESPIGETIVSRLVEGLVEGAPPRDIPRRNVPPGHHLVYFPPDVSGHALMPDGAEKKFCPGPPFVRRLWVGGSLQFAPEWSSVTLDHRPFYCLEHTAEPTMRPGSLPGKEGVSVEIKRTYLLDSAQLKEVYTHGKSRKASPIEETRELLFLRQPSSLPAPLAGEEQTKTKTTKASRPLNLIPDFSFELIPDNTLLFHFSALSYNAHAIHLNPDYARNVEGHEGLLVHGPLTVVLMLYALQAQCRLNTEPTEKRPQNLPAKFNNRIWMIKSIDYRNIRPLYAGKKLKVCVKSTEVHNADPEACGLPRSWKPPYQRNWRVWIENEEGQMAVKARAVTVQPELATAMREARGKAPPGE